MIYVHVPFCRSFCTYCGFYSEAAPRCRRQEDILRQEALFEDYVKAVTAEAGARQDDIDRVFASDDADTLYIGGGTPSVLSLSAFYHILKALGHDRPFAEFTIEVNPEDIVEKGPSYVRGLASLGVNRVSMGVQSFDDGILRFMNRRHSSATAVEAYRILEAEGISNISIDLIFGLPQLTDDLWEETLDKALNISSTGMPPKHISAYQLSVEPGSMLERLIEKGKWEEADEQQCERQYSALCSRLRDAGYHHYEISNFAQPGFEAVHNSSYWKHVPYVGLGPGAHSFIPCLQSGVKCGDRPWGERSIRRWNIENLQKYIQAGKEGDFTQVQQQELLNDSQLALEKVMLGLRTSAGLPEEQLRRYCRAGAVDAALVSGDLVPGKEGHLRIPESRFFISDNIILNISDA